MTETGIEAGRPARPATGEVQVWDIAVRVFHWSLVAMFTLAYATHEISEGVHVAAGYVVLGLVVLRLIWGVIGTRYARFTDFVYRPSTIADFMKDTLHLRARRYLGHNPAGGAMVVALLAANLAIAGTGIMMTMDRFWGQKWVEDVHEAVVHVTLVLIALHVLGVVVASLEHGENLVRSMFTGRKRSE